MVVDHLISAREAPVTEATTGDPRAQVLDVEPSPFVQIEEADYQPSLERSVS